MPHTSVITSLAAIALLASCSGQYGNIALNKKAYHSSAFNYDLTAQLAVDGIVSDEEPSYYTIEVNGSEIAKEDMPWMFDYRSICKFDVSGSDVDLVVRFHNMDIRADSLEFLTLAHGPKAQGGPAWIEVSEDGETWERVASYDDESMLGERDRQWYRHSRVTLPRPMSVAAFRFVAQGGNFESWEISNLDFFLGGEQVDVYNAVKFSSVWMPRGTGDEWIYVDLGDRLSFSKVILDWLEAPTSGEVLVSDDASTWNHVASFTEEREISAKAVARYVKVACGPSADGRRIALREMQVLGREKTPTAASHDWVLVREDLRDNPWAWVPCEVPTTVLAAYIDAGIVPDPAWADNNQQISDSYFNSNFIYKGKLKSPDATPGHVFLNFDGVNWKADVTFNGTPLGHTDGAFIRSQFDVTDLLRKGDNDIEVLVHKNDHPSCGKGNTMVRDGYNGGILGADNPTFHASVGWDWIPSVHGRNIGIWNDVYFSTTRGPVQLKDPFVRTVLPLPDTTKAEVTLSATLRNLSDETVTASWDATIGKHSLSSEPVTLNPGESRELEQTVTVDHPRLWWPNGYGAPNLYDVHVDALAGEAVSDCTDFKTGLRQNTYELQNGRLTAWVNGRRFSGRGGNWGFSEYNLRFRASDYDTAVRLHKEQNFTMIRNWVGQIMDDEFYEACDRYGIMIWQDFWLANPWDGPDPYDEKMFMENADDLILRIRNHPSIVVYVGRNEGEPPASLDTALAASVRRYHGDIFYAPDSSHGYMGGNGRYNRFSTYEYFRQWADHPELWGQDRVHSEKGCPNVPNFESFVKFIPEDHWWPQDEMWAFHDWTLESAQKVSTFNDAVWGMFGEPEDAEQFCQWAQWVNYDAYRAIFESRSEQRRGIQLWMSHSAWPTFVWCTYDYWFDPTAAYFACRKACEPLHVMWNPLKKTVEVVNVSAGDRTGLTVEGRVLDMWGNEISASSKVIDSREDSTVPVFGLPAPDEDVYFYSLSLIDGDTPVSTNFYVLGREEDNFKALHKLGKTTVASQTEDLGGGRVSVTVTNTGDVPAMMVRLMATDGPEGDRLLPVIYSDNYFHLMPGESRTLTVESRKTPYIRISGFNL